MYNPQLETFIRVVAAGSFNKAAGLTYISPTAVIKQINLLEDSIGLKLFVRTHRGLILTEAGKSLYRDAKYIIQYSNNSITRAKNAMQETENVIRIGTSPTTPAQLLMSMWCRVTEKCPDIKFKIIPFDNTPENAKEILGSLGKNIDILGGIFDDSLLSFRQCAGLELKREPLCCAVSLHHPLARKEILEIEDLYGEQLMMMHRGWSHYCDKLRDDLVVNHPQVQIVDFDFYDMNAFNRCENGNYVLLSIAGWETIHPLIKIIPVKWDHSIPYGILHSPQPTPLVQRVLEAVKENS